MEKKIGTFPIPRQAPLISHLLYADDIVIFANGGSFSVRKISKSLQLYERWSGQKVSSSKSSIIFSNHIAINQRQRLLRILGFVEGKLPFKYLGVPILAGRLKAVHLEDIVGKIKDRIEGLQNKILPNGSRVILLRQDGKLRKYWKSWEQLCLLTSEGGMGFRNLQDVQKTLFMKFAWKLLMEDSLWSQFFKAKYMRDRHVSLLPQGKGTRFWKKVHLCLPEVLSKSKWKLRRENASFWWDRWMDDGPIGASHGNVVSLDMKVTECWVDNEWDEDMLIRLIGEEKTREVIRVLHKRPEGADVLVWLETKTRQFTAQSAWNCVRVRAPKVRCHSRAEGKSESVSQIWMQLKHWVVKIGEKLKTTNQQSSRDIQILQELQVPVTVPKRRCPRLVSWFRPDERRWKMNVDGASKGNPGPAGAGGVLRDSAGNVKMLVKKQGIVDFEVELDSWEGNKAADFLARLGAEGRNGKWWSSQEIPPLLRGILRLDKIGFPSIHM
ncbi:uncharacterized protein LOC122309401 [Carya illinoinensis]|uniref:uncharacterized protein LOC122309401 n=1 Tax=Carya illinoinensis TaxID=32201 RepID=UPI001C719C3E|nr:uncharacterized protein LOC122309401 [Carya illinoinensis]